MPLRKVYKARSCVKLPKMKIVKPETYTPKHLDIAPNGKNPYIDVDIDDTRARADDGRLLDCFPHVRHPVPVVESFDRKRVVNSLVRCVPKFTSIKKAASLLSDDLGEKVSARCLVKWLEQLSWWGFHTKLGKRRISVKLCMEKGNKTYPVQHIIRTPRGHRGFGAVAVVGRTESIDDPYES